MNYFRFFWGRDRAHRVTAVVALSFLISGLLLGGIALAGFLGQRIPDRTGAAFLHQGNVFYARAGKKKAQVLRLNESCASLVSTNGKVVWFTAPADDNNKIFDLYQIVNGKAPAIRAHDVENTLVGSADGDTVLYRQKNSLGGVALRCRTDRGNTERKLVEDVADVFFPARGGEFWYTKKQYGTMALFRADLRGKSTLVDESVTLVTLRESEKSAGLLYLHTEKTEDGAAVAVSGKLCLLPRGAEKATEIAQGVDAKSLPAFLQNYRPGENLYFFQYAEEEKTTWRSLVADKNADADAKMKKPDINDFFHVWFLSPGYTAAEKLYAEKQTRDRVRAALDDLDLSGVSLGKKMLCAWDGKSVMDLVRTLPADVLAARREGAPGVVAALHENQTTGKDLADYAGGAVSEISSTIAAAIAELTDAQSRGKLSFVVGGTGGARMTDLDTAFTRTNTTFSFSLDGTRLFALTRRKAGEGTRTDVYVQSIQGKTLSPRSAVQTDCIQAAVLGEKQDVVWCILPGEGGKMLGDLYRLSGDKRTLAAQYVADFSGDEKDGIVIFHHPLDVGKNMPEQSRLSYWANGKTHALETTDFVLNESVRAYGNTAVVYLVPHGGELGGELRLWRNGKTSILAINAEKVLVF
ncbi:MAG: hypothetical protein LBN05_07785 [Oscillospiraceae bacterium]|nr:hypothetical protein [Oscillospiraceae bacterium]